MKKYKNLVVKNLKSIRDEKKNSLNMISRTCLKFDRDSPPNTGREDEVVAPRFAGANTRNMFLILLPN